MKKYLMLMCVALLSVMTLTLSGCKGCKSEKKKEVPVLMQGKFVVENIISTDKQFMYVNYGGKYSWFETCILLKDYLDEDCNGDIAGVSNVFQVVTMDEGGGDSHVILMAHTPTADTIDVKHGFWIEDCPMNNDAINITYRQAFDAIMRANYPKPHSRQCTLRKPIGPKDCNPQWVFGNIREQLWVDAVTGDVATSNPTFAPDNDGAITGKPLGEWP